MRTVLFVLFLFFFPVNVSSQESSSVIRFDQNKLDSIIDLREQSRNKDLTIEERFTKAERARRMSYEIKIDTTIIKSNRRISVLYKQMGNLNLYKRINHETMRLAEKINDSSSIAWINFSLGSYFQTALQSDSAFHYYYSAEKMFIALDDKYNAGRVLLNMAIIQKNEKDYIGSENTSITAISYMEVVMDSVASAYRPLSSLYNNLAIVSEELEQYDKAIEYYNNALDFHKKSKDSDPLNELFYLNNLGIVYQESGQYDKALEYFEELLDEKDLYEIDPSFYARILDNLARTKFLMNINDKDLPTLFLESLSIKDRIDDKGGSMRSNVHLADYYLAKDRLDIAKTYADSAYVFANKHYRNDDKLEILLLLSQIETGEEALAYTHEYITLNDSLQKEERAIRNKFGRIKFDTDKIEEQNVKFSRERELFLFLAIAGLVGAILVYIIISQRARNKELRYNQEQQKANEEIYNLMLSQQDKIEEGRTKEKQRISEDLHDGILGRLFGTRLSLDSLNMSSDENAVKNRGQYIEELKSIEQEIRRISHDLNADFVAGSGYLDIVKTLIESQTQTYNKLSYNFIHKDEIDWESVSNKTKIHFYRMIQESLQNIYKHANAKHVDISFEIKGHQIYLNIEDDGEGFVVNKAKKGIGLKNIKSRVEELKGELFINSQIDAGTRISISVPL